MHKSPLGYSRIAELKIGYKSWDRNNEVLDVLKSMQIVRLNGSILTNPDSCAPLWIMRSQLPPFLNSLKDLHKLFLGHLPSEDYIYIESTPERYLKSLKGYITRPKSVHIPAPRKTNGKLPRSHRPFRK